MNVQTSRISIVLRSIAAAALLAALVASLPVAHVLAYSGTLGGQLYATGGPVTVTIEPADANDLSYLYLYSPGPTQYIGTNREIGKVVNLGTFPVGVELVFGIYDTVSGYTYKMGPASRNPDNVIHAVVDATSSTEATVGFEDGYGGYDRDYNDNIFHFSSVVVNPPPVVTGAQDQSAVEGSDTPFNLGSFTDTGNDGPWAVDVNWGDGSAHSTFQVSSTGSLPATNHTYADNGTYPVTVAVADSHNGSTSGSFHALVANAPPTATLQNDGPVDEGSAATIRFSSPADPSSVDTDAGFHYAFACDGGSLAGVTYASSGTRPSTTCSFDDGPSTHSVVARIIDKDDGYSEYTTPLSVANVPPSVTLGAPTAVSEGGTFTLALTNPFDPSHADTTAGFTYRFDCGDGSGVQSTGSTASASCVAPDVASLTVHGTISDKDNGSTAYSAVVTVNNVAPTVGPISVQTHPVEVGTNIAASASFTDPGIGLGDQHTAVWDWGDGTTSSGQMTEATGAGSVSGSHTYTAAGLYAITLTVTDKDDATGNSRYQYVVIYDPSAGLVTGGGWITSPAGACRLASLCQGADGSTVNLGFNAKYQGGSTTPSGSFELQIHGSKLNFHADSYQWLVIRGAQVEMEGTGTINGAGSYQFLVSAIDGKITGGNDAIRVKIWDAASGSVVYDTQPGAANTSAPTTPVSGGNITVHSK